MHFFQKSAKIRNLSQIDLSVKLLLCHHSIRPNRVLCLLHTLSWAMWAHESRGLYTHLTWIRPDRLRIDSLLVAFRAIRDPLAYGFSFRRSNADDLRAYYGIKSTSAAYGSLYASGFLRSLARLSRLCAHSSRRDITRHVRCP